VCVGITGYAISRIFDGALKTMGCSRVPEESDENEERDWAVVVSSGCDHEMWGEIEPFISHIVQSHLEKKTMQRPMTMKFPSFNTMCAPRLARGSR
jgi:hypothetical protein